MKKSERGFVLAETLVVAVAVMGIFSLIYANYYPLIGEYEKREVYDDLDSKYTAHWVRKILMDKKQNNTAFNFNSCSGNCHIIYSSYYQDTATGEEVVRKKIDIVNELDSLFGADNSAFLANYINAANVRAIIITNYNLQSFKNYLKNNDTVQATSSQSLQNKYVFNRGFREYVDYLPNYTNPSVNGASYRVIVIVDHDTSKEYDSYGTIEVRA